MYTNTYTYTYTYIYAGFFEEVYRFSASESTWTALSPTGSGPSPRADMNIVATPDGMLYVFGGWAGGNEGGGDGAA
jgi:hypothetical protein